MKNRVSVGGAQREHVLALQFLASGLEATFLVWEGVKGG